MILSGIDKTDKIFQFKMMKMNTVMININLPISLRQLVRNQMIQNQPTEQSQNEMKEFLELIPPSMSYKIMSMRYKQFIEMVEIFSG